MPRGRQASPDPADAPVAEISQNLVSFIQSCVERELRLQTELLQQKLQEERDATQHTLEAVGERLEKDRREKQSALEQIATALAHERAARDAQLSSLRRELSSLLGSSTALVAGRGVQAMALSSPDVGADAQLRRMEGLVAAGGSLWEAGVTGLDESLLQEVRASTASSSSAADSPNGNRIAALENPTGRSGEASRGASGAPGPLGASQPALPVRLPASSCAACSGLGCNLCRDGQSSALVAARGGGGSSSQVRFDLPPQDTVAPSAGNPLGAAASSAALVSASASPARSSGGMPRTSQSAAMHPVVTPTLLDRGGMYVPKLSLWDVMLFVGHDCLGPSVSVVIGLVWLLNFALQTTFIAIVYNYMLEEAVTDDMLQGLLQFRLGPAHSIEFADRVTHRSLAAQVCEHDFKLPVASGQEGLLDTIRDFTGGGIILSILATILWLMTVMQDMQETTNYMQALLSVRRGGYTSVRFVDSDNLSEDGAASRRTVQTNHTRSSADESLITLVKVARVTRLGRTRAAFIVLVVGIPKLFIGMTAGIVGAIWLAHTNRLADLVLDAVALAFVLDIDSVIFSIFVPRRARTLMANLEPLPLPARKSLTSRLPAMNSLCKMLLLLAGSMPIFTMVLWPEYSKQQKAVGILCSGNLDFVYATNSATDMVYVAKSSRSAGWTYSELAVLQAAQVEIEDSWGHDIAIYEGLQSITTAVVFPKAPTLSEAEQVEDGFPLILEMSQWSIQEAARVLPCRDLASGQSEEAAVWKLRDIFRDIDMAINGCEDIPKYFCSKRHMTELRSICPNHCECDRPRAVTGFFETSSFGCPTQCESFKAAFNEIKFRFRQIGSFPLQCEDFPPEQLGVAGSCVDQDRNRFDSFGDACDPWYTGRPEQCSVGHNDSATSQFIGAFDDDDFTATLLCCACGGGNRDIRVTPAECFREFTDDCYQLPQTVVSWVLYVRGMWEALSSRFGYNKSVELVVNSGLLGLNETEDSEFNVELIESVTSGELAEGIASGVWNIMSGVEHPRNLTGCEFLTSHEIKGLLNVDLCFPSEHFTPLSFFCPRSCGCDQASSLSACPAACVLNSFEDGFDHPWFGGESESVDSRYEELPFPEPFNDPYYLRQLPFEISQPFYDAMSPSPTPSPAPSFLSPGVLSFGFSPSPSDSLAQWNFTPYSPFLR